MLKMHYVDKINVIETCLNRSITSTINSVGFQEILVMFENIAAVVEIILSMN